MNWAAARYYLVLALGFLVFAVVLAVVIHLLGQGLRSIA